MLTSIQTTLVQESFALIAPVGEDVAALFYQRLFEIDPTLRRLFKEDIGPAASQARADADGSGAWATVYGLLATTMKTAMRDGLPA
jgi:hemoglobin-like flavoprotein